MLMLNVNEPINTYHLCFKTTSLKACSCWVRPDQKHPILSPLLDLFGVVLLSVVLLHLVHVCAARLHCSAASGLSLSCLHFVLRSPWSERPPWRKTTHPLRPLVFSLLKSFPSCFHVCPFSYWVVDVWSGVFAQSVTDLLMFGVFAWVLNCWCLVSLPEYWFVDIWCVCLSTDLLILGVLLCQVWGDRRAGRVWVWEEDHTVQQPGGVHGHRSSLWGTSEDKVRLCCCF